MVLAMKNLQALVLLLTMLLLRPAAAPVCFAQTKSPRHYLMIKPGDEAATPAYAADFLRQLSDYFAQTFGAFKGALIEGFVTNDEQQAVELVEKTHPVLVFASPAFYLKHFHGKRPDFEPILEFPRLGAKTERFYLVTAKNGPDSLPELRNQIVKTNFPVDEDYLRKVVFPQTLQPGRDFILQRSQNLSDDIFMLIEGEAGGFEVGETGLATAVLLNSELRAFFAADELVWPEVKIVWQSRDLPRDLVLASNREMTPDEIRGIKTALLSMAGNAQGRQLLRLMQSGGLAEVNWPLLNDTIAKYFRTR